jgi:S1-C subfamily serine protease
MEMMRRTRQTGVPVIADEQEAIVGFDMPRLKRMASRHKPGGGLGLAVADSADPVGAKVGRVREDSPGARVGIQPGDIVVEMSGRPVGSVRDLEQISAQRPPGAPTSLVIVRDNERLTLILRS